MRFGTNLTKNSMYTAYIVNHLIEELSKETKEVLQEAFTQSFMESLNNKQKNNENMKINKYGIHLEVKNYEAFTQYTKGVFHTILYETMKLSRPNITYYQIPDKPCYRLKTTETPYSRLGNIYSWEISQTCEDRVNLIKDSLKVFYTETHVQNTTTAHIFDEEISLIDDINTTRNVHNINLNLLSTIIANLEGAIKNNQDPEIYKERLALYKNIEPLIKNNIHNNHKSNKTTLILIGGITILILAGGISGYIITLKT